MDHGEGADPSSVGNSRDGSDGVDRIQPRQAVLADFRRQTAECRQGTAMRLVAAPSRPTQITCGDFHYGCGILRVQNVRAGIERRRQSLARSIVRAMVLQ
jgi:hypothetical protein